MSAYTVSRLALDAGVSVHIVRDYLLRGLLRPVAYTTGGYGLFDDTALQRLRFVRAAFEAGIGLDALARLCRALDAADGDGASAQLAVLRQLVERRREALASLEMQLAAMNSPEHLPSETHKPITGYLWGALAVLTCPCHLPILAIVLAGTTAGAFIGEHWGIAALTLTGLFVLSVTRLLRAFKGRS
ncbi:TPA: mercury resistance co-regulator MerD [Citrobacter amalonaticus]|nr:mercury resistance co-regulator MerD [Citrobacter amalonaticus]